VSDRTTWSMRGFSAATALLFVAITLLPVGYALIRSLWGAGGFSLDAYRIVLNEGRQWTLLLNSLGIAFGTTLVATVLGVLVGFSIEYIRVPARRALSYCVAVPFLVPPYISAVAWIDLLGENGILTVFLRKMPGIGALFPKLYSIPGVILVLALTHYPIVVLTTVLAIRRLDRRFEEAAQLVSKKARVLRSITLPLLAPGILSGALFVFILALVSFSVPSLLQVDVYPVEIYSRFSAFYDFRGATAQALPLVLTGAVVLSCWALYIRPRQAWLSGARRLKTLSHTGSIVRTVSAICCWSLVALSAALPIAVLIRRSLPLTSYVEAWLTAREEIATSILVATGSATLLATLGFSIAYLTRRRSRGGGIYALSVLPFLLSGPVIGIGLILLWNHHGMRALVYDSLIVMVFACTGRFLFFAHQGTGAAMRDMHASLEEAASVAGVPWWRQVTGVLIPILRPSLFGVWALGFLFSLRELDATVLVCPPGSTTLPVRLFTLMHYGPSRIVAALSVITAFMILFGGALTATIYAKTRKVLDARY
jgi:iron(III) transport system permease protein